LSVAAFAGDAEQAFDGDVVEALALVAGGRRALLGAVVLVALGGIALVISARVAAIRPAIRPLSRPVVGGGTGRLGLAPVLGVAILAAVAIFTSAAGLSESRIVLRHAKRGPP
jgi:hypothetical protein